jgi:hypothetical protein
MKNTILSLIAVATMFATACTNGGNQPENNNTTDTTSSAASVVEPEKVIVPDAIPASEVFYDFDSTKALVVANPITYDVVTKCYVKDDEWQQQCVANTNTVAIANAIFQAVYKGRLTPYDYVTEQPMPIDSVKAVEKRFTRKQIGKIMFTEKWYFSEATLSFTKKVEAVTLGYELIDKSNDELRGFKPAFLVKLNEAK